jgi:DNA-binding winged helix-turn-helix (wHTH) protein
LEHLLEIRNGAVVGSNGLLDVVWDGHAPAEKLIGVYLGAKS